MRNFRKLRTARKLRESARRTRRKINESVENEYGFAQFSTFSDEDQEALNEAGKQMTLDNFLKFNCETTKAIKEAEKNGTEVQVKNGIYPGSTVLYNIVQFLTRITEKAVSPEGQKAIDSGNMLFQSGPRYDIEKELVAKYPELESSLKETRRPRKSSPSARHIAEARKLYRLVKEALAEDEEFEEEDKIEDDFDGEGVGSIEDFLDEKFASVDSVSHDELMDALVEFEKKKAREYAEADFDEAATILKDAGIDVEEAIEEGIFDKVKGMFGKGKKAASGEQEQQAPEPEQKQEPEQEQQKSEPESEDEDTDPKNITGKDLPNKKGNLPLYKKTLWRIATYACRKKAIGDAGLKAWKAEGEPRGYVVSFDQVKPYLDEYFAKEYDLRPDEIKDLYDLYPLQNIKAGIFRNSGDKIRIRDYSNESRVRRGTSLKESRELNRLMILSGRRR